MSIFNEFRDQFHAALCGDSLGRRVAAGPVNIADSDNETSKAIGEALVSVLRHRIGIVTLSGTAIGTKFAEHTRTFLERAFSQLSHLRPGTWLFATSQGSSGIAAYDQYEHLIRIQSYLSQHPDLRAALGGDYIITPDIHVGRMPVTDSALNQRAPLVASAEPIAKLSPIREGNVAHSPAILHASISCKWTMRSDRAQNTRTEALNLIRNRKGRTPHIMVVTAEPLPTRLASIARGTGDVDCTYHAFLHELIQAVPADRFQDQREVLMEMVEGRRLRDISDLPLDLAT